jgi:hypothetical protein
MDSFEFSQYLVRLNDLIESKNIKDSEFLLDQLKEKLEGRDDLEDESKRLKIFEAKLDQIKANIPEIQLPERTDSELLSMVIKEMKVQHGTLKNIEWYLKFYFWLTIIGLILIVISWLL